MKYQLEVIAFTIDCCRVIEAAGAHRIELCDNPCEGGTTPSYGLLRAARGRVGIELAPMIRPRGGDFLYSDAEFEVMKSDVLKCRDLGCDAVVLGLLCADGTVDRERTARLAELAYPLDLVFHRAFDRVRDPEEALETLVGIGCTRILTSGLQPTVTEGAATLARLVEQAGDRLTIMPGSGVRSSNLAQLVQQTGARAFHTSARTTAASGMEYHNPSLQENLLHVRADATEIQNCLQVLQEWHLNRETNK
ncbi:MAG TPA: copper homeostasis protein CutC [Lacibacter sp.]|nr:copper homeostasis protein CutC [Lacibacter sp.]HMO89669.1 copper homeostasis protein CutC [Lacibacter sp.]HMP86488.1 copper homeostasis protein CutC [Lacibacter sp.]